MEVNSIDWVLLGFTVFHQVPLRLVEFVKFDLVLPSFIEFPGFDRVLYEESLVFTGFFSKVW